MPTQARVIWDQSFTGYNFGADHPMNPLRLDLTARLCEELGLFSDEGVEVVNPAVPGDELLLTVHDADYVAAVRAASVDPAAADLSRGLGTEDDPAFVGMHEASARIAAGSVDVARAVWEGRAAHGVNFCGGLHHAMPGNASGFCIYNDAAIAIQWLLDHGAQKVAYVDVDVHHGDGVERMFWDDPRVLTISLHESGRMLFPGTGFPADTGGPGAEGTAVNVALPPGTGDAGLAARLPRRGAGPAPVLRARRAGHPARLRLPLPGPAGAPGAVRGRPADVVRRAAQPGPRGLRRPLGGPRRRRLRARRRRAPGLDAPDRHRRAPPDPPGHRGAGGVAGDGARAVRPARTHPHG